MFGLRTFGKTTAKPLASPSQFAKAQRLEHLPRCRDWEDRWGKEAASSFTSAKPDKSNMASPPGPALTNYHKLSGLKQHKFLKSSIHCKSDICLIGLKIRTLTGLHSFLEGLKKNRINFLAVFGFHSSWLPPSVIEGSSVASL